MRKQRAKAPARFSSVSAVAVNFEVHPRKLGEHLQASATRRRGLLRFGRDRDAVECAGASDDCGEYGETLGADSESVRGVLDVAPLEHGAVAGAQSRADRKAGVRR